jgi:hypothetical protein
VTLFGVVPADAVLYTNKPVAGVAMVLTSVVEVNATRGGRKPLLDALTSSEALALGVVVPIPTCAVVNSTVKSTLTNERKIFFINGKIRLENTAFAAYAKVAIIRRART